MTLQATVTANEVGATLTAFGMVGEITACMGKTDEIHAAPHAGTDIAFPAGSSIPCFHGGFVVFTSEAGTGGWSDVFGNSIIVNHGDGTLALYAHLAHPALYKAGDTAKLGSILGTQGNTGYSFGEHLHLGLTTEANPWFNKDADGGVSRLLDPLEHLDAAAAVAEAEAIVAQTAEPAERTVLAHRAQYVADAALRLRQTIEGGGAAFAIGINADLMVDRATELRTAAKAL